MGAQPGGGTDAGPPAEDAGVNCVSLVGRLAAPVELRTLPSGDLLATWRLVVSRPAGRPRPAGASGRVLPTVDTLDCMTWRAPVRRAAGAWLPGDVVEVRGALRRRFWRTGGGAASRYEVEVDTARRVRRHASGPGGGRGPPAR